MNAADRAEMRDLAMKRGAVRERIRLIDIIDVLRSGDGPKDYDEGPGYERALDDMLKALSSGSDQ